MPRGLSTDEQTSNIALVQEIEKNPCLYNYKIKEYSRIDVTDAAWEKIATAVNDTVPNCKEKWRNLRTVFIRKQKPPPSGSGKKASKAYYLNDVMQFVIPFVKVQNSEEVPGNIPSPPSPDVQSQQHSEGSVAEENIESEASHELAHTAAVETSSHVVHTERRLSYSQNNTKKLAKTKTKPDLDSAFIDYFQDKKKRVEEPDSARKHFLLSVLPDIENLSDSQFRVFRRQLLDNIDYARSYQETLRTDTELCQYFPRSETPSSIGSITCTNLSARSVASPNYPQQQSFPPNCPTHVSESGNQKPSPASSNVQSSLGSPAYPMLSSPNYPDQRSFPSDYSSHTSHNEGQKLSGSSNVQYCDNEMLLFHT